MEENASARNQICAKLKKSTYIVCHFRFISKKYAAKFNIPLVLIAIPICIQGVLLTCLHLRNAQAVKIRSSERKEGCEYLSQVCQIYEGFPTQIAF